MSACPIFTPTISASWFKQQSTCAQRQTSLRSAFGRSVLRSPASNYGDGMDAPNGFETSHTGLTIHRIILMTALVQVSRTPLARRGCVHLGAGRCRRSAHAGNCGVVLPGDAAISVYGDLRLVGWWWVSCKVLPVACGWAEFMLSLVRLPTILSVLRAISARCLP